MKRLKWAWQHKDWKKVLAFVSKWRVLDNLLPNEWENCIVQTVKYDEGAVIVWGYSGGEIAGDFVQIKSII